MNRLSIVGFLLSLLTLIVFSTSPGVAQSPKKYWVYFSDKGPAVPVSGTLTKNGSGYHEALQYLTPKALARRAKVLSAGSLVDAADIPLYKPYLERLQQEGAKVIQQIRFLNAASFLLTSEQVHSIEQLSFVKNVTPVAIVYGREEQQNDAQVFLSFAKATTLNYGPSLNQVQMINIPPLHNIGIAGKGILVGMLDTGFRWRAHESLVTRNVIAEYDFIQHDVVTANQPCDSLTEWCDASNQDQHGTLTMSALGGFMPGKLIGPAFDVDFVLAKTEYVPVSDYRWEEDNWAAGIEWLEGFGADVVSSSLGYNTFIDAANYTWANGDFNGRTTICAQAAVRAARMGVVVCPAMGNEGNGNGIVGTMLSPADADSIISVGAVNYSRLLTSFSSTGPTNDNRFKPDVVSPGSSVYAASTFGFSSYSSASGTSLATPLVGGTAAVLLSARPELTPIQVRDAIRNTADTIDVGRYPSRPNNFTGWGLVNAFNAALSFGPIFSNSPAITVSGSSSVVTTDVVSKFGINPSTVILHYAIGTDKIFSSIPMSLDSSFYFPTSGRYKVMLPPQSMGTLVRFYIDAQDSGLHSYQSPAEVTATVWQLSYGITDVHSVDDVPASYALYQNYPNPFNPATTIKYQLPAAGHVMLKIYNVLGQEVRTLVDEVESPGLKTVEFDAGSLPSGVYFYRLTTSSFVSTKKMMFLR